MGRQHSSNSFDRNLYVLQPQNGGSGCITEQELKEKYGYAQESDLNAPGGILAYDEFGRIETSVFPEGTKFEGSIGLKGPRELTINETGTYVIVNYDPAIEYFIEFNSGTVSRVENILTVTAVNNSGNSWLKINNQSFPIFVKDISPRKPSISVAGVRISDSAYTLYLNTDEYVISNQRPHLSTEIEISRDIEFKDIVHTAAVTESDKTKYTTTLPSGFSVYVRVRFISSVGNFSEWSDIVVLNPSDVKTEIGTPGLMTEAFIDGDVYTISLTAGPFVETETGTHIATTWELAEDLEFTRIIKSENISPDLVFKKFEISTKSDYIFARAKYHTSRGTDRGWSSVSSIRTENVYSGLPIIENSVMISTDPVDADSYGGTSIITNDGNTVYIYSLRLKSDTIPNMGIVFIYKKNNGVFELSDHMRSPNPTENGRFGQGLKLNNREDTLFIGSDDLIPGTSAKGIVYIYKLISNDWVLINTINGPSDRHSINFGATISTSSDGSYVLVGAYGSKRGNQSLPEGCAYLYRQNINDYIFLREFNYVDTVLENEPHSVYHYGFQVSISENADYLFITGRSGVSKFPVYKRSGLEWNIIDRIVYDKGSLTIDTGQNFGISMIMSGDAETIMISDIAGYWNHTQDNNSLFYYRKNSSEKYTLEKTYTSRELGASISRTGACRSLSITNDGNTIIYTNEYNRVNDLDNVGSIGYLTKNNNEWKVARIFNRLKYNRNSSRLQICAISGNGSTALVHSPNDSINENQNIGSVTILERPTEKYQQYGYLNSSSILPYGRYGQQMFLSDDGKTLAVSSIYGEYDSAQGKYRRNIYIYKKVSGSWILNATGNDIVLSTTGNDTLFKIAVSGDGTRLAIVSDSNTATDKRLSIFRIENGTFSAELRVPDSQLLEGITTDIVYSDRFYGPEFSLDGTRLVLKLAGKDGYSNTPYGVYNFSRTNLSWVLSNKIISTSVENGRYGYFTSFSRTGNYFTADMTKMTIGEVENAGRIVIYKVSNNFISYSTYIDNPDPAINAEFGICSKFVGENDEKLFVSSVRNKNSDGVVTGRIYEFDRVGDTFVLNRFIDPANNKENQSFGRSFDVSKDGKVLAVGSPKYSDVSGSEIGLVTIYKLVNNSWTFYKFIENPVSTSLSEFGFAVKYSNDDESVIVSSYKETIAGNTDAGKVYYFNK